jgi:hypothetical protein
VIARGCRVVLLPVFLIVVLAMATGCGTNSPSPRVTVTVTAPAAAGSAATAAQGTPSPAGSGAKAQIGDTVRLKGTDTTLDVTVVKVADPVHPKGFDAKPDNGRWAAVYVRVRNVGDVVYSGSIWSDTVVVNTDGNQFQNAGYRIQEPYIDDVKIDPGSLRAGWVTIDCSGKLDVLQFTPDPGSSAQTGEWRL